MMKNCFKSNIFVPDNYPEVFFDEFLLRCRTCDKFEICREIIERKKCLK